MWIMWAIVVGAIRRVLLQFGDLQCGLGKGLVKSIGCSLVLH